MPRWIEFLIGICALSTFCSPGRASAVLYDTFGPGITTSSYYAGGSSPSTFEDATPFVPSFTSEMVRAIASLGAHKTVFSPGDAYQFSIWTDSGGHPGVLVEAWALSPVTDLPVTFTFSSVAHPTLFGGTQYWGRLCFDVFGKSQRVVGLGQLSTIRRHLGWTRLLPHADFQWPAASGSADRRHSP